MKWWDKNSATLKWEGTATAADNVDVMCDTVSLGTTAVSFATNLMHIELVGTSTAAVALYKKKIGNRDLMMNAGICASGKAVKAHIRSWAATKSVTAWASTPGVCGVATTAGKTDTTGATNTNYLALPELTKANFAFAQAGSTTAEKCDASGMSFSPNAAGSIGRFKFSPSLGGSSVGLFKGKSVFKWTFGNLALTSSKAKSICKIKTS